MTTSSGDSARLSTAHNRRHGANGCRSVRLIIGEALPVSRYPCAHHCCCCTSVHVRGGPSSTTNERRFSPLFYGHASKLIYEEGVCSSPRFRTYTNISVRMFSKKSKNFLRKFEREFSRKFRDSFFSRNFFIKKGLHILHWDSS